MFHVEQLRISECSTWNNLGELRLGLLTGLALGAGVLAGAVGPDAAHSSGGAMSGTKDVCLGVVF